MSAGRFVLVLDHGVEMDFVIIPAGEFWMGSDYWREDEKPLHKIFLPEYWIGKYLVTVAQYTVFVHSRGYPARSGQIDIPAGEDNNPVVQVNWFDAMAFCQWIQADLFVEFGGESVRLPTEAEWEKAARGTDGRDYPWGAQPPDETLCNYYSGSGISLLSPVGKFSPKGDSPFGCADMAGNVWEWTHSIYRPYPYIATDGREGEDLPGARTVRGGAMYNFSGFMRCSVRAQNDPERTYTSHGFRVCVLPDGPSLSGVQPAKIINFDNPLLK